MVRSDGGNALTLFEEGQVGIHYGIPDDLTGKNLDEIRELYKTTIRTISNTRRREPSACWTEL